MELIVKTLFLTAFIASAYCYCPSFLQNQTACSCEEYIDGAIVKCSGKESPLVVEQLKSQRTEIRELWLEHAKIIEVNFFFFFQ